MIVELLNKKYGTNRPNIKISETITIDESGEVTEGVWSPDENAIIIKRSVLNSKEAFSGVLMHEYAHYVSGYSDNTRDFENILTEMLGYIYNELYIKKDTRVKKFGLFGKRKNN